MYNKPMKILITSGGATEKIDSVHGTTSHTTGSLGKHIAEILLGNGYEVTLVTAEGAVKPQEQPHLTTYTVSNVDSLVEILEPLVKTHDVLVHSMATSNYTPIYMTDLDEAESAEHISDLLTQQNTEPRISSKADYQVLFLKKTPKVISLVKTWNPDIMLIGFRLSINVSRDELFAMARTSLKKNKAYYIIANDLNEINGTQHCAYLLSENDITEAETKTELAKLISKRVTNHN